MEPEIGKRQVGWTVKALVIVSAFLLVLNLVLGYALESQSRQGMQTLINERMLDIANTAAAMLDGDSLATLRAEDANTEAYQSALKTLGYFQDNIDLEYIYCIRQVDDTSFVFTVDPTVGDPGEFGEPVVYTKALYTASQGTPAVDEEAYEDAWGRFYSAYSPVFDSDGKVAGIVAVDFDAEWYEGQIMQHVLTMVIIGALSLVVGALIVIVITSHLRKRFKLLYRELTNLARDVESLTEEVVAPTLAPDELPERIDIDPKANSFLNDDIDVLGAKIRAMQGELRAYIQHVEAQAYADGLTGVGNKAAYLEEIERLAPSISDGTANFALAVFDINGLKQANDDFGHETGDAFIKDTAQVLCDTFGLESVFRVGGDEFLILREQADAPAMEALFATFDEKLAEVNSREDRIALPLAISKGVALFDPNVDEDAQSVFRRADEAMYSDKSEYYRTHSDRRRR